MLLCQITRGDIMIELYNNYIRVTDQLQICSLLSKLTRTDPDGVVFRCYDLASNNELIVPRGLLSLLDIPEDNILDKTTKVIPDIDTDNISGVLGSITLRDDQVFSITKMTSIRRGIIQLGTGAGKTECLAGFLKNMYNHLGSYPNTLILEPTAYLVESTINRFNKYGIPAKKYSECRGHIDGSVVTHPKSLNNDLKKDPTILSDLSVFLTDECHRLVATTYRSLIKYMDSVEFALGVSASAVSSSKIPVHDIDTLDESELKIVGATGPVLVDIQASYYIDKGILAKPILLRVNNPATEYVPNFSSNWHLIRKKVLESDQRNSKCSGVASFFSSVGMKSLILVGTKEHAYQLMAMISESGLGDQCRASFGGGEYYEYDPIKNKPRKSKDPDIMEKYSKGEFKILVGTSHIYEGADIPNLDVVIFANVGKEPRRVIQGTGRGLRSTKTGNYAYIVDFTDHGNDTLRRHSIKRTTVCRTVIGVKECDIYGDLDLAKLKYLITQLEPELFTGGI